MSYFLLRDEKKRAIHILDGRLDTSALTHQVESLLKTVSYFCSTYNLEKHSSFEIRLKELEKIKENLNQLLKKLPMVQLTGSFLLPRYTSEQVNAKYEEYANNLDELIEDLLKLSVGELLKTQSMAVYAQVMAPTWGLIVQVKESITEFVDLYNPLVDELNKQVKVKEQGKIGLISVPELFGALAFIKNIGFRGERTNLVEEHVMLAQKIIDKHKELLTSKNNIEIEQSQVIEYYAKKILDTHKKNKISHIYLENTSTSFVHIEFEYQGSQNKSELEPRRGERYQIVDTGKGLEIGKKDRGWWESERVLEVVQMLNSTLSKIQIEEQISQPQNLKNKATSYKI